MLVSLIPRAEIFRGGRHDVITRLENKKEKKMFNVTGSVEERGKSGGTLLNNLCF